MLLRRRLPTSNVRRDLLRVSNGRCGARLSGGRCSAIGRHRFGSGYSADDRNLGRDHLDRSYVLGVLGATPRVGRPIPSVRNPVACFAAVIHPECINAACREAAMSAPGGDSPEAIAWQLLLVIARAEGVHLEQERGGWSKDQILATYRECLAAVRSEPQETPAHPDADNVRLMSRKQYGAAQGA